MTAPSDPEAPLPQGFRGGLITAITVFLGFSLAFLRFWGLENPGDWKAPGILAALLLGLGIVVQLVALFRALQLADEKASRYQQTVKWFFAGVSIAFLAVVWAIIQ